MFQNYQSLAFGLLALTELATSFPTTGHAPQKWSWDDTKYMITFGDSYTYVQGLPYGLQNYSFIGDFLDPSYTPQQLLESKIIQNQVDQPFHRDVIPSKHTMLTKTTPDKHSRRRTKLGRIPNRLRSKTRSNLSPNLHKTTLGFRLRRLRRIRTIVRSLHAFLLLSVITSDSLPSSPSLH